MLLHLILGLPPQCKQAPRLFLLCTFTHWCWHFGAAQFFSRTRTSDSCLRVVTVFNRAFRPFHSIHWAHAHNLGNNATRPRLRQFQPYACGNHLLTRWHFWKKGEGWIDITTSKSQKAFFFSKKTWLCDDTAPAGRSACKGYAKKPSPLR